VSVQPWSCDLLAAEACGGCRGAAILAGATQGYAPAPCSSADSSSRKPAGAQRPPAAAVGLCWLGSRLCSRLCSRQQVGQHQLHCVWTKALHAVVPPPSRCQRQQCQQGDECGSSGAAAVNVAAAVQQGLSGKGTSGGTCCGLAWQQLGLPTAAAKQKPFHADPAAVLLQYKGMHSCRLL
jgi:hypothetical protein